MKAKICSGGEPKYSSFNCGGIKLFLKLWENRVLFKRESTLLNAQKDKLLLEICSVYCRLKDE